MFFTHKKRGHSGFYIGIFGSRLPPCSIYAEKPTLIRERFAIHQETWFKLSRNEYTPSIEQTLIYVCCLSFVLCHRRWLVDFIFFNRSYMADTLLHLLRSRRGDGYLSNFACLQLRLKEGEDISGTLVIKCGIILQQALVCI